MISVRTYVLTFVALSVLLAATTLIAFLNLGTWNVVIALSIASAKALLIALYFMHLSVRPRLMAIVAGAGLLWLGILLALTLSDAFTRAWPSAPYRV